MLGSPIIVQKSSTQLDKAKTAKANGFKKNGAIPDIFINGEANGTQMLGSEPILGGYKRPQPKRTTAIPTHLSSQRQILSTSIVSFVDSPMLATRRDHKRRTPQRDSQAIDTDSSDDEQFLPEDSLDSEELNELSHIPDGGYGWVVVWASFCMQALTGGIAYVQGLMYPQFLEALGADRVTTAWVCSMQMSIWFTGGLIAGPLVQTYGARTISICGTLVIFVGLTVSAFAYHIWMLYVFYGFVCGLGMSMIFFPAVIIVQHYFTKKRAIAVAFANAGTPFGAFLYPMIVSYLIKTYGWRGELIIIAALSLNGLVFASFFRPVTKPKSKPKIEPLTTKPQKLCEEDRSVSQVIISSVVSLGQASITSIERSKLKVFFTNLSDFSLWKNPNMVFDVFAYGLFAFGFILPSMFMPLKASENGILPPKPEILLSVMGLSDVVGRLSSGLIGTLLGRKRLIVYGVGMVICGTASIFSSFLHEFGPLAVYTSIFGLCTGMSRAYSSVVVTDMLGIENLPKAYGFKMFINGICVLNSGPLAAFIFETTNSLDLAFMVIGGIQVCGGGLVFILLILRAVGWAEVI